MRGSLRNVLARLDRLAAGVGCREDHRRFEQSIVWEDSEEDSEPPPWPEPGAPLTCVCGARLDYVHDVLRIRWTPRG